MTFAEIMVAVGIFAVVILGVIQCLVVFQRFTRSVSEETIAHGLAVEIIEQVKNAPDFETIAYGGAVNQALTLPASATTLRDYAVHPILSRPDQAGNPQPVRFGVTITPDATYPTLRTVEARVVWHDIKNRERAHRLQTTVCRGYTRF